MPWIRAEGKFYPLQHWKLPSSRKWEGVWANHHCPPAQCLILDFFQTKPRELDPKTFASQNKSHLRNSWLSSCPTPGMRIQLLQVRNPGMGFLFLKNREANGQGLTRIQPRILSQDAVLHPLSKVPWEGLSSPGCEVFFFFFCHTYF